MIRAREEAVLLVSALKWFLLASITGAMAGAAIAFFVKALEWGPGPKALGPYFYFLMPAGFLLATLLVRLFPDARGHGANNVIEAIHKRSGSMKLINLPVEFAATWLTITSGGSAGKEGPSAQIGGALASFFSDLLRFEGEDRKKLVICGISAGFASVFGTPLAGAVFGIEVLFAGAIVYEVLLPSFVAGIVSYQVSSFLGLRYLYHPFWALPAFSLLFFIKIAAAGVFFGLASLIYIEAMRLGRRASAVFKSEAAKCIASGCALAVLTYTISTTEYLGLGVETIRRALDGGAVPWYAFLMKAFYTSVTLNFGGSGGIGTPIFFIGSTAGAALSKVLGADPSVLAAIGFVSLLAGAANTPIAASIMAFELFGISVAPYAALSSVICFVMAGHRSAYPSQVLAVSKSASVEVEIGSEVEGQSPVYRRRERSLIGLLARAFGGRGKDKGDREL